MKPWCCEDPNTREVLQVKFLLLCQLSLMFANANWSVFRAQLCSCVTLMSEVLSENDTSFAIEDPLLLSSSLAWKYGFRTFGVSSSWSSSIGFDFSLLSSALYIKVTQKVNLYEFSSFVILWNYSGLVLHYLWRNDKRTFCTRLSIVTRSIWVTVWLIIGCVVFALISSLFDRHNGVNHVCLRDVKNCHWSQFFENHMTVKVFYWSI